MLRFPTLSQLQIFMKKPPMNSQGEKQKGQEFTCLAGTKIKARVPSIVIISMFALDFVVRTHVRTRSTYSAHRMIRI